MSWAFITVHGDPTGALLPPFYFPTPALLLGDRHVAGLGFGTGLCPAFQASRLRIVDALRRN